MPEYAIILLAIFVITVFIHIRYKLKLYRSTTHLFITNVILLVIGVAWDQYAIYRGHWSFGEQFLLGPRVGYMPIEEFGFLFICTYFVFVLYKLVEKFLRS